MIRPAQDTIGVGGLLTWKQPVTRYSFTFPSNHATTGNARYWISHSGGFTLREVDQSQHSDQWVSLGTYTFSGTDEDYISLSDVTYETYLSTKVAWDAMKWEKQ